MYDTVLLKKRQDKLLLMMKDIDKICKDNNINYSLTGGSLLGCIRHEGFIPWDDDVDLMFNRKNYELLKKVLFNNKKYKLVRGVFLQKIETIEDSDKDNTLFIDVFTVDNLPDNKLMARLKIVFIKFLQGMLKDKPSFKDMSIMYKLLVFTTYMCGKAFSRNYKLSVYDKISAWGNSNKTGYVSITNDMFRYLNIKHKSTLLDAYEYKKFEDTFFMCTTHYDDYLITRYGNYMEWPEESKRVPTHDIQLNIYRDK